MKQKYFAALLLLTIQGYSQINVPLTSDQWTFDEREPRRFETVAGQEALYLNGHAMLKNVVMRDGMLEVDFIAQKPRAFAGLQFRAQGEGNNETLYVRLHKSGFPDAVQYNPEFNGEANWQLYREHQAAVRFDPKNWNHLKVEFRGTELKAYLNDMSEPILRVENLRRDDPEGFIGFYSFLGAYFANFKYTPFKDARPIRSGKEYEPNVVQQWELSYAYEASRMDVNNYPAEADLKWESVAAEPSGLLPINKYRTRTSSGGFEANPVNVVWARHILTSQDAGVKKFSFDFSDDAVVYFNGVKIFEGKNGFRAKGPTFRGDMLIDGNTLYLPALKGENELLIAVSDKANGWGLMGKIE